MRGKRAGYRNEGIDRILKRRKRKGMKKTGIINKKLCEQLAGLGHTDCFLVCDAGFPVPRDAICIDLAIRFGEPGLTDCVDAILSEVIVEEVAIAEESLENNRILPDYVEKRFRNQRINTLPQKELAECGKNAKFIVRSGDVEPYSNILLTAASGVEKYRRGLVIEPD